jgi:hypothetical protein
MKNSIGAALLNAPVEERIGG